MPATSDPPPGSVIASEPMVSPARVGRTNRSMRSALPLEGDVGQRDAAREQPRHQPAGRTLREHRLLQVDRVEQRTAPAADRLGKGDAQQPLLPGREVELARDLAGVLPLLEVWSDLAAYELRAEWTRSALFRCPRRVVRRRSEAGESENVDGGHMSSSWTCTTRERIHSPSPLACGSNRVDAATPLPRSPWTTS